MTIQSRSSCPTPECGLAEAPATAAEWGACCLLAAACVAAPLALGSTAAWLRLATEAAMAGSSVLWGLSAGRGRRAALLPIAIAALFMVQLIPLPDGALTVLSPVAAGAWKLAHADNPSAWGRITVDPSATAAAIRRLLLAVATVVTAAHLGRKRPLRQLLAAALCVVCIAIWALGLAFPFDRRKLVVLGAIDFTGPIAAEFWKTPIEPPISTNGSGNLEWITAGDLRYQSPTWIAADAFGPYIYANHFAAALALTLPALLGAWLSASRGRLPNLLCHALAALVFAASIWTVGIMAASRAGAAGLILAALVFASLTLERLWARRTATAICCVYGGVVLTFTIALYGGFQGVATIFPEPYQQRISAMLMNERAMAARTALRMFCEAPLLGSGLGTFGDLFPRFLRTEFLLHYAHNDYAQWLAETGIVGAALAFIFFGFLAVAARRWRQKVVMRRTADPITAGLWAGLAGSGLHTAFDWNLHIPANALLACVTAGLAIAAGATAPSRAPQAASSRRFFAALPGVCLALACLVAVATLARDAASDRAMRHMRTAIVAARLSSMDKNLPSAEGPLRRAISAAEKMEPWDPANGNMAVLLGICHLHLGEQLESTDDKNAERANADRWFGVGRLRCATCRGLPEKVTRAKAP